MFAPTTLGKIWGGRRHRIATSPCLAVCSVVCHSQSTESTYTKTTKKVVMETA